MASSMTPIERRKQILDLIEKQSSISVFELCRLLGVSEMTIRRDLRSLSNAGLLERVYGGALLRRGRSYEPPFLTRMAENIKKKQTIARRAAALVVDGDSIALDIGTTTLELAKRLRSASNLTVITASIHVANVLNETTGLRLILTGGIVRNQEQSLIGHIAERTFADFHVDKAFVGVGGINLKNGLTEYNIEDTLVKRAMIDNADQVIVVADSSKLGKSCFATIAPLSVVDILVTDPDIPAEIHEQLTEEGVQVLIASP